MAKKGVLVNDPSGSQQHRDMPVNSSLASWVLTRVKDWEDYRKNNFDDKWDEYYRLWRGLWDSTDRSRKSERSKLIAPALSQAIEATVSELEEATFGQGRWFDVSDDTLDQDPTDIAMWRDQLSEDFDKQRIPAAVSEVFLNGTLYGTGIGKLILEETVDAKIVPSAIGDTDITEALVQKEPMVRVGLIAVHPKEFVIDPAARSIEDAMGMAHITTVPRHSVLEKQADGIYKKTDVGAFSDTIVGDRIEEDHGEMQAIRDMDKTMIIEYHGLVPKRLLEGVNDDPDSLLNSKEIEVENDESLVEAIVTIANGAILLRAVANPYLMGDRCFIAYQHDTVPNRFWGRGVAEKGYNPQKALDAEMRGRIDAMALSIHPMMGIDATRVHRGGDFRVEPGRNVFTNGDPNDILRPFNFGQVNNNTFAQSGELERMVQMGTGAMDSATPLAENRRNETSSGMSMIMGGAIKRSKRTLANIERMFMRPLVNKSAWRYMQFAPDRYPVQDIKFNVHSTLGIVARELEQQQMGQLMNSVPAESPAFWMLLKGVFEFSTLSNREEMLPLIDQMMQQSMQKQANPEPDPLVQIKMKEIEVKGQIEQAKLQQKEGEHQTELQLEIQRLMIEAEELRLKKQKILLDAQVALAGQEQDSMVTQMQMGQSEQDSIRRAVVALKKGSKS